MAITITRGHSDPILDAIINALKSYEKDHAKAKIDLYRLDDVSVRIRIIDPSFQGLNEPKRHDKVWQYLDKLPEEVQSDVTMLVLVTPKEKKPSFANLEFEDPIPV